MNLVIRAYFFERKNKITAMFEFIQKRIQYLFYLYVIGFFLSCSGTTSFNVSKDCKEFDEWGWYRFCEMPNELVFLYKNDLFKRGQLSYYGALTNEIDLELHDTNATLVLRVIDLTLDSEIPDASYVDTITFEEYLNFNKLYNSNTSFKKQIDLIFNSYTYYDWELINVVFQTTNEQLYKYEDISNIIELLIKAYSTNVGSEKAKTTKTLYQMLFQVLAQTCNEKKLDREIAKKEREILTNHIYITKHAPKEKIDDIIIGLDSMACNQSDN